MKVRPFAIALALLLAPACKDSKDEPVDTGIQAVDEDGDGSLSDVDCDDTNPAISPTAPELCDGLDNNCNGLVDDDPTDGTAYYVDADRDGYGGEASQTLSCEALPGYAEVGGDCNDADQDYHPGATESDCSDPNDYNCDGSVGFADTDGDGFAACQECDDSQAAVNPSAAESCDDIDNDCDGAIDEDDAVDAPTWYIDVDGDGFGSARYTRDSCDQPSGFVDNTDDCDDTDADINPNTVWYADLDGDGYGDPDNTQTSCVQPSDYISDSSDCDDTNAALNPDTLWFLDGDGDGYGRTTGYTFSCEQPSGYADNAEDCNDSSASVSPAATEFCDLVDNDCDGFIDEDDAADARTYYQDADRDTFGDPLATVTSCEQPSGFVTDSADCDDSDGAVNPTADEICNDGLDNDCDGGFTSCYQGLESADARIYGESANSESGVDVSLAGDINGDGVMDLIVGATKDDTNGADAGAAYLLYGPFSGEIQLSSYAAKMVGDLDDQAGRYVSGGHDLTGDGVPDMIISGHRNAADLGDKAGVTWLVAGPVSGDLTLSTDADLEFQGQTRFDRLGVTSLISADASGDGQADVIMGAPYSDTSTSLRDTGTIYVANGPFGTGAYGVENAQLIIQGESANDIIGDRVAVGDVNGDGVDDILVGVQLHNASTGAIYFVYGGTTGRMSLANADVKLDGQSGGDTAGQDIAAAGDADGDGYNDVITGAPGDDDGGSNSGAAYVISGQATTGGNLGTNVAKFLGASTGDAIGTSVAGSGDVDGDGNTDFLIGGSDQGLLDEGAVYLVLGPVSGTMNVSAATARFDGENADDGAGSTVEFFTDLGGTGDGRADIAIGAPGNDFNGTDSGALYLLFDVAE